MADLHLNAIAFQEGDAWVIQGIEYDIVAHTRDVAKIPHAFARAVVDNILISKQLGREPLAGIRPAPKRFKAMFEQAETVMHRAHSTHGDPEVAVRLLAA